MIKILAIVTLFSLAMATTVIAQLCHHHWGHILGFSVVICWLLSLIALFVSGVILFDKPLRGQSLVERLETFLVQGG